MPRLIILDIYGTILKADAHDYVVRPGLPEFLAHYKKISSKVVLFSDGPPDIIQPDLLNAGLEAAFDAVYDRRHCVTKEAYEVPHGVVGQKLREAVFKRGGGDLKRLELACADFSVSPSDAVFIGDNFFGRDKKAAVFHGVRFVLVPQFRESPPGYHERASHEGYVVYEDPNQPFSFTSLIDKL